MNVHTATTRILSAAQNAGEDLEGLRLGHWTDETEQNNLPYTLVDGTAVNDELDMQEVRDACHMAGYTTEIDDEGVYLVSR
jgi:hypothetical protein